MMLHDVFLPSLRRGKKQHIGTVMLRANGWGPDSLLGKN